MRSRRWRFATGPGDFLPLLIGCLILFISLPAFLLLLFATDENWGVVGVPLLVFLGAGTVIGFGFIVWGVQLCALPGSLVYRLAHGRFFSR